MLSAYCIGNATGPFMWQAKYKPRSDLHVTNMSNSFSHRHQGSYSVDYHRHLLSDMFGAALSPSLPYGPRKQAP